MVVVGGRNSSNTRRLLEICEEAGALTYLVETPGELEPRWFQGIRCVGIASGASTPEELAGQVKKAIEEINGVQGFEGSGVQVEEKNW